MFVSLSWLKWSFKKSPFATLCHSFSLILLEFGLLLQVCSLQEGPWVDQAEQGRNLVHPTSKNEH